MHGSKSLSAGQHEKEGLNVQLNLDTICEYFPEDYQIKRYGYADRDLLLERPLLYEEASVWEEGKLYIARADILPKSMIPQNIALICVGRRISKEWALSNNQILLVLQETSVFSVFNQVSSIFADFAKWEYNLLKELGREKDFDIHRFLKLGEEKFGNPVSVSDSSLRIILSTDTRHLVLVDEENTPRVSESFFNRIQGICQVERMVKEPYLSSLTTEGGTRHYCYNLYPMGYFAGCVWISEFNHPFRESDFMIAAVFFDYFRQAYMKYLNKAGSSNKMAVVVLHDIFEHKMLTREEEAWLALKPGEAWMFFRLKERSEKKHMPKDYMCAMINTMLPDQAFAVVHGNSIRGLWKCSSDQDPKMDSNMQAFQDLLTRMEYVAAFSNQFTQIRSIGDQLLEAGFIIRECLSEHREPILYFKDHILEYWLGQCTDRLPVSEFCSSGITELKAYDKKKNTSYIETLKSYLNHQCSVTATARELYINRSSMVKRLDKIKAILHSDLSDPEELLYYSILFRLM